ncbi:unnamed protein product [Rotaria sp. Silwood1]|nr:unnamed protein product [Rotaria sp. Silwood1]CAF0740253.1 unnamed protein product [Rotaria sp. Silwood1]CAF0795420.1 unnamed protein product [Rotaria sp. Silwood1]CAF3333481.1 unnamed protein product [Rotaria sp. Silwood1]CAF3335172.1 unnamed protein product [Rotaria sp. Silwood1]
MNIDNWLVPLPLNELQQNDYNLCQEKLYSLLNLPLRIHCLPSEILLTNSNEQTTLTINNRNPLKMYWHRNLNELRLFLKRNQQNQTKLDANIIEIHKRRRLQITRYIKQDLFQSSVIISFSQIPTTNSHIILLTITGKHCILELQIPSINNNELIYHGTYRKMGEDAQLRSITALFNCTIHVDKDMALLLSEYGLCRIIS